jgi:hypothetical protein
MTEVLDLARLFISDRVQREVMNDDRDAALSASRTMANESHHATVRHLDQLKQLVDVVDPPIAILLKEGSRQITSICGSTRSARASRDSSPRMNAMRASVSCRIVSVVSDIA